MKKNLPKFLISAFLVISPHNTRFKFLTPKGFTLVELLVVIVILAILGVVGMTLFSGTQQGARDAKRKADIQSLSKSMEANYVAGTGYTTTIVATWFADQAIPTNPAPGGASYSTGTITTAAWTFCAALEKSTGNATSITGTSLGQVTTGVFFCKRNAQ